MKKKQIPTTKTVKIFKLYKMLVIIFQKKNEIFKKKVASTEPYTNFSNILPIFR